MLDHNHVGNRRRTSFVAFLAAPLIALILAPAAYAATANVTVTTVTGPGQTNNFSGSLRWLVEEDTTWPTDPANPPADLYESHSIQFHKSHMPVAKTGVAPGSSFQITGLDANKRYYLSILPDRPAAASCTTGDDCYSMAGTPIRFGGAASTNVRVTLTSQPQPPAQMRIFAFQHDGHINKLWEAGESGLGGFTVFISEMGGPMLTDVYGNPLGTVYQPGTLDGDAAPTVLSLGDGTLRTLTAAQVADPTQNPYHLKEGELLVQNIAPGKYAVQIVPPENSGWQQVTTIEGTKVIDAWVRAGEPPLTSNLVEFGPTFAHVFVGFVREFDNLPASAEPPGSITGVVSNLRFARPPEGVFYEGQAAPNCWVALNSNATGTGIYAAPCKGGDTLSEFTIDNVPPGTYELVVWDRYLDIIIGFFQVNVESGLAVDLGKVSVPYWFHRSEHYVFDDLNEDGMWQPEAGEKGIPDQAIVFRFRDGSVYSESTTDTVGYLPFDEVFPFFSWLIAEVDFGRFKATGMTVAIDDAGPVVDGPIGRGILNPQIQDPADGGTNCDGSPPAGCKTRTELSSPVPVLLEGFNGFAGNTNVFEWGKKAYGPGEHGGIAGIVFYQVTRAENDPRYAAAEPWEPGIPRVQVNLYRADALGVIKDTNGAAGIQLADVDNYPLGWQDNPGAKGPEDIDRNTNGSFDMGDAIEVAHTDSWDESLPEGCRNDHLYASGVVPEGKCYDNLSNWAQVRPAVFDGGFGFCYPFTDLTCDPGTYVVEANAPPGYMHQDEVSKNVDFGDTFTPHALPPLCIGDPEHTGGQQAANVYPVGTELTLFPGVELVPAVTGTRPGCNFKPVLVTEGKNAAPEFFMYTDVPLSGHIQGLVTNDLGAENDPRSPLFVEKIGAAYIPISLRDHQGNELNRIYSDKWGRYNGLVPSSYNINVPAPSGVGPSMAQVCLNASTKPDPANAGSVVPDPFYDPRYSQTCYVFNFTAGRTTYLDTPVLPVAGFTTTPDWQLDCAYANGTPVIREASINGAGGLGSGDGPYIATGGSRILTLRSLGTVSVPDPTAARPATIARNYGFGADKGKVILGGKEIPGANVTSWSDSVITVNVPTASPHNATGQLKVERKDGVRTEHAITLIQGGTVSYVSPGQSIQSVIDAAPAGSVVMVRPGLYYEGLFITKPIQLQGFGATGTVINAARSGNFAEFNAWRGEAHRRTNCPLANESQRIGLLPGQPNNVGPGTNACAYLPGTGLFNVEEHAGAIVAPRSGVFGTLPARIDGLTFTGAEFSGGIVVNGYATNLEISNNIISNNQGQGAGGIRIGQATLFDVNNLHVDAGNKNVLIHDNFIAQNGSTFDPGGGIGIYNGADNYKVHSNYICGNFSQGNGGGIAHYGRSPGGVIQKNRILFNQTFDQTAGDLGGFGGGILVGGLPQPAGAAVQLTAGSGSVQVHGNLIQGNQAGSGDGGGIALRFVNGQDVLANSNRAAWHKVDILNNIIVNNVAGLAGGGISLQDTVLAHVVNNTIANNDSTATAQAAFGVDPNASIPQPAGIVSRAHSAALDGLGLTGHFSKPWMLENNIILGNRAQRWVSVLPGSNPPTQGLLVHGVWDLASTGVITQLDPQRNILTDDPINASYNANNPRVAIAGEDALLKTPYYNRSSGSLPAGAFNAASFNTPLLSSAVGDEGGNFVNVVHGPLALVGDYHLENGSSAIDPTITGDTNGVLTLFPLLLQDYDADKRPVDGTNGGGVTIRTDLGADERSAVAQANNEKPQILSLPPSLNAFVGQQYSYQVVAVDPNGTAITYIVTCKLLNGSNCNPLPTISGAGLMTWTPSQVISVNNVKIRVESGGDSAEQSFVLNARSLAGPPVAANNSYTVDVNGAFSVAAPGVLGNDSASAAYGAMTAQLVSNLASGGSVSLAPSGSFIFQPAASFVGVTSFTYQVSATILTGPSGGTTRTSNVATVTLSRELAATSMQYFPAGGGGGVWTFSGFGSLNGRTVTFRRDRGNALIGSTVVGGNAWAFSTGAGPDFLPGDTVNITASVGPPSFTLVQVPVAAAGANGPRQSTDYVQCPGDTDGDAVIDAPDPAHPDAVCKHLAAGDGWIKMADGAELYTFGFSDVTGVPKGQAIETGILNAQFPAPTLDFDEGDEVYLTLTNTGTLLRPDLFDPHSVHFHGFPNAGPVFDGVPESSITINMGFSLTYYYKIVEAGTFMYHCHVEAPEHMQMGMLGNLYVRPAQNGSSHGGFNKFVYNDNDGSTGYDVEVPIQIGSMDRNFHDEHIAVQPLPFLNMHDDYPMLNGRGYPDTVNPLPLPAPDEKVAVGVTSSNESSQTVHTRIEVNEGDRLLLRISNLNVTRFYTLATTGLPMKVVGTGAHILRGPKGNAGSNLYYTTNSVTLGGGEAVDVLIDTTDVAPGIYLLYSTNLEALSNGPEDFGGMMTEIVIN